MARTETVLAPATLRENLRVYNVYESGQEEASEAASNQKDTPVQPATHSDANWPSDWQRMPPYRESSRTHRVSDRAAGQSAVECAMVVTMFSGVWLLGNINRMWRSTAGKWNDHIMRYKLGGES